MNKALGTSLQPYLLNSEKINVLVTSVFSKQCIRNHFSRWAFTSKTLSLQIAYGYNNNICNSRTCFVI